MAIGFIALVLFSLQVIRMDVIDLNGTSAPDNPDQNIGRLYYDSVAKAIKCLNSDGTSCSSVDSTTLAPNVGIVYVSPNCGTQPNCFPVKGDVRITADCATTNTSPTVTSAKANFTSADVGKKLFCINPSTGAAVNRGTVVAVGSTTSVTSSVNSTATTTGATLAVGTDDALSFHNAYNAAVVANQGISLPCGMYLLDSNAPVFNEGVTGNPTGNYSFSGCSSGGESNATVFILGPDLLDTPGDLVASIPLLESSTIFPVWAHGSSYSVSNLQIEGLSYLSAAAYNVINVTRGWNLRIYDMNSTATCWNITHSGTRGGEQNYRNLNIQTNLNGLMTHNCNGVNITEGSVDTTAQGDNIVADSIIAFISGIGMRCSTNGGTGTIGLCTLRDDYFYQVGSSAANVISINNHSVVNVFGGHYFPASTALGIFASDGSSGSGVVLEGVNVNTSSRPVFSPSGNYMKVRDSIFTVVLPSNFFTPTNIATSHFYNLGGNSITALPTGNLPIYVNTPGETQTVTCSAGAAMVTYKGTYFANPSPTVYDQTTVGLVPVTQQSLTTLTLGCPGPSDVLNVTLTPNPF